VIAEYKLEYKLLWYESGGNCDVVSMMQFRYPLYSSGKSVQLKHNDVIDSTSRRLLALVLSRWACLMQAGPIIGPLAVGVFWLGPTVARGA
jgi:hypothetical protein